MFDGLFQPTHLLIILLICLLIFGPTKLPQLGRGLGEGIREFRKSMAEARNDANANAQPASTAPKAEEKK